MVKNEGATQRQSVHCVFFVDASVLHTIAPLEIIFVTRIKRSNNIVCTSVHVKCCNFNAETCTFESNDIIIPMNLIKNKHLFSSNVQNKSVECFNSHECRNNKQMHFKLFVACLFWGDEEKRRTSEKNEMIVLSSLDGDSYWARSTPCECL